LSFFHDIKCIESTIAGVVRLIESESDASFLTPNFPFLILFVISARVPLVAVGTRRVTELSTSLSLDQAVR
jgi:hypothetical protein